MRYLRALVAIPAFVVFPLALLVAANATFLSWQLPHSIEQALGGLIESEEGRRVLADDLSESLLSEPKLSEWSNELPKVAAEIVDSTAYRAEVVAFNVEMADYIRGDSNQLPTVDLLPALAETQDDIDPELFEALSEVAAIAADDEELSVVPWWDYVNSFRDRAAIVAAVGLIMLALASQRPRVVLGSVAFVMGPVLAVQAVATQVIRHSTDDPVFAPLVRQVANEWLLFTGALFVLPLVSGILFVKWPKHDHNSPAASPQDGDGGSGVYDAIYRGNPA